MPTDVTSTIGSSGRDYSTLQAWEDACPSNLVTDDKRWIGNCYDDSEFTTGGTTLSIGGITVDSTRYVVLQCATGESFADKAGVRTTALFYDVANGVTINTTAGYTSSLVIGANYTRIRGIQFGRPYDSSGIVEISVAGPVYFDDCLMYGGVGCIASYGFNGGVVCRNCLFYVTSSSAKALRGAVDSEFYGCTITKTGSAADYAFSYYYGTHTVKNCAIFNFTNIWQGGATKTITYSATDLSSMSGTGNVTSLTFADQFENSTNDFRAKSTGDLQAGTPDSTNTPDDITGLTRDATTPWIGCWEVAGGGGGTTPKGVLGKPLYGPMRRVVFQ